ncbi:unnamed protein product [Arctogadus glacialis]
MRSMESSSYTATYLHAGHFNGHRPSRLPADLPDQKTLRTPRNRDTEKLQNNQQDVGQEPGVRNIKGSYL